MAIGSVLCALQAHYADDRGVKARDFIGPLRIRSNESIEEKTAPGGPWQAALVRFPIVRRSDFKRCEEPDEAMFAEVRRVFLAIARFLDARDADVFDRFRAKQLQVRLFVDVWMNEDQMEVEFPMELVAACGRKSLPVFVISNDISAAEAMKMRDSK